MPAKKKRTKPATIHELPKPAAESSTRHAKAPEVEAIANRLIPSPGLALGHLTQQKVAYLFTTAKQIGCNGFASSRLFPAWARVFGKFDFLIIVSKMQWDNAPERIREAAVAHALSHCELTERSVPTIAHHDYEDFGTVAKRYGAWSEGGRVVAKQLRLIDDEKDAFVKIEQQAARAELATQAHTANGNGEQKAAD